VAGFEALFAGSVVGLMSVATKSKSNISADYLSRVGALYLGGHVTMSTWIPFVLAWINLLVLIISSFSIQGGL
jgi:hypothetical protein